MFDFQIIDEVLRIDPSYIALFAAMVFGFIQALKGLGEWADTYAQALVFGFSGVLAALMVLGFTTVITILALTQVISAAASGLYSWGRTKTVIELPDYSDSN